MQLAIEGLNAVLQFILMQQHAGHRILQSLILLYLFLGGQFDLKLDPADLINHELIQALAAFLLEEGHLQDRATHVLDVSYDPFVLLLEGYCVFLEFADVGVYGKG